MTITDQRIKTLYINLPFPLKSIMTQVFPMLYPLCSNVKGTYLRKESKLLSVSLLFLTQQQSEKKIGRHFLKSSPRKKLKLRRLILWRNDFSSESVTNWSMHSIPYNYCMILQYFFWPPFICLASISSCSLIIIYHSTRMLFLYSSPNASSWQALEISALIEELNSLQRN